MTKDYENANHGGTVDFPNTDLVPDEKATPWTPPSWSKEDVERGYQVPTLPPEKGLPSGLPEKDV
jgi:hypothetical protein